MTALTEFVFLHPGNRRLIAGVCVVLVGLMAVPMLWSVEYALLIAPTLLVTGLILFSVPRTLLAGAAVTILVPAPYYIQIQFPLDFRLAEACLIAASLFAVVEITHRNGWKLKRSAVDGAVAVFLLTAAVSAGVGYYYGNETSLILRNLRFPLYYFVIYLITQSIDSPAAAARSFSTLAVLTGVVISITFILEFVGLIDLSGLEQESFRVARRQGILLPIALLLATNQLLQDPRRYGRLLPAAVFVVTGLGLSLTLARGMLIATIFGFAMAVWLRYREQYRAWRSLLMTLLALSLLIGTALMFQRVTGTALTAHAVERSRTFVDYQSDVLFVSRLLGYGEALEAIQERPILGSGQGSTVTSYTFDIDSKQFERWISWTLDSLYLTLWMKMGLPGLIAFIYLCTRIVSLSSYTLKHSEDPRLKAFGASSISILAAFLVLGLSDGTMVNGRFTLLFGMLFGCVAVVARAIEQRQSSALSEST